MAAALHHSTGQHGSQRPLAMALALAFAVVLSPLYVDRQNKESRYGLGRSSGFVLPVVLAGLIIAIKRSSSGGSLASEGRRSIFPEPDPSWVLRIGGSSLGLATILVMLMLVLSWQGSFHHFFWR